MERLRLVHIGVGGFGTTWVSTWPKVDDIEVVALVDINPRALSAAGEKLGIPPERRFTSLDSVPESIEYDAALVVVPPGVRMPIYEKLIASRKHIICEKPLADTWENARRVQRMVREAGVKFVVSQNYRYHQPIQALKKVIDSGVYGEPVASHVDFYAYPRFFGFREEIPYPLLVDMSIHHFDLMRYVLNANPVNVIGRSWNGPWSVYKGDASATVIFEMERRKFVTYTSSWSSLRSRGRWVFTWHIECENGIISLDEHGLRASKFWLNDQGQPTWSDWEEIPLPPEMNGQVEVLRQFTASIRGGPPAATSIDDNIYSFAMVTHAIEACETRRLVTLPPID